MSKTSQNGWPIVGKAACDQGPFHGVTFPNGILAGDVAAIARWQLDRYALTVEPLVKGWCWGWFVKVIEGTATASNHGSATAWDINAEAHPMGTAASHTMSAAKIAACRAIVKAAGGVLRWGGDYTGRPDPMHWEIIGTRAEAAAFARKIKGANAVENLEVTGTWPLIGQGADDALVGGYDMVHRIQRAVGVDPDGVWGPKTTAAVGASKMTEDIYRRLFGLTRTR